MFRSFDYRQAFSRNIGWVSDWEQQLLRSKRVAIAGLGGVGGYHLLTLARLGIGAFHIADFDRFDIANFNRQMGANMRTIGLPKAEVMSQMALDINPELDIKAFPEGVTTDNLEAFLEGVDVFVDGLDFFVLDARRSVFAKCREKGIPAVTAAPLGMGVAYLVFTPDGMSFEDYFHMTGLTGEQQYVSFALGLGPAGFHRRYIDNSRVNMAEKRGPSTPMACQLCAGVAGTEVLKLLLKRGKVRPAPWYSHFDAYLGRWKQGRLGKGNRSFIQATQLRLAFRFFLNRSRPELPPDDAYTGQSEIRCILDLARWAPSGDNTQPWRFRIRAKDHVVVELRDHAADDVYDFNGGQPTLISAGALIENMAIAASRFGKTVDFTYEARGEGLHILDIRLKPDDKVQADPLVHFIVERSVCRQPMKRDVLADAEKVALETAAGPFFQVEWHETAADKNSMTRINGLATRIRLAIKEAFAVHQRIIDWDGRFSPDRIPAKAVGLSAMTLKIMKWSMKSWSRTSLLNGPLGGTLVAKTEMDVQPGRACAAHFSLRRGGFDPQSPDARDIIDAGRHMQRFWLTATRLGLSPQPAIAPLIFGHYGRYDVAFTASQKMRAAARQLSEELDKAYGGTAQEILFRGRIGQPRSRSLQPRSVRKPLSELIVEAADEPDASAQEA